MYPRSVRPRASLASATALAATLVAAALGGPADATLFVKPDDAALADRATVIVEGRVLAVEPVPEGARPAIDYLIEVEQAYKGSMVGGTLIVRVPGGVRADGVGLWLRGAPRLRAGERALLFLRPRRDGTFTPHQLFLGVFHLAEERTATGDVRTVALRDLEGAIEVVPPGKAAPADGPRDLERFRAWLRDHLAGHDRPADYFVRPERVDKDDEADKFELVVSSTDPAPLGCGATGGHAVRWPDFDQGGKVGWRTHLLGQTGLPNAGVPAVQTALAAWSDDPNTGVVYEYLGLTTARSGLTTNDGVNAVLYGDPNGEIAGTFDGSGLLALSGPFFTCDLYQHDGRAFHPILEADVVTQDGLERFFAASAHARKAAEELFAHELGHTLGLAHSAVAEALMSPGAHDDGRGAALDVDDLAALWDLYGGDAIAVPAAPANLRATAEQPDRVLLEWSDAAGNESNFRLERRTAEGEFALLAIVKADATSFTDARAAAETTYVYRLRAQNGAGASAYSAEAAVTTPIDPRPKAPSNLRAAPLSSGRVRLSWQDNADDETAFVLYLYNPADDTFVEIPYPIPGDQTSTLVSGLAATTTYTFRLRAKNGFGFSPASNAAAVTTFASDVGCETTSEALCLLGGRFRVEARFLLPNGGERQATALPSSDGTGLFWLFDATNIELIVKMLDGGGLNGRYWLYYGGVSNLEFVLTVTDTASGEVETYHNPSGQICGLADTDAFVKGGGNGAAVTATGAAVKELVRQLAVTPEPRRPAARRAAAHAAAHSRKEVLVPGTCEAGPETLCLLEDRIKVEVRWRNPYDGGSEGRGQAVVSSENSGEVWFFSPDLTELVVKALDGSDYNDRLWLFYGSLTDVEYWITATDTVSGVSRVYHNPAGEICGRADIQAFPVNLPAP